MIAPAAIQAAIIALLKANAALVAGLASDATRIKEAEWQGTGFEYPCCRVNVADMQPSGNGNCAEQRLAVTGSIIVYSKGESSAEALLLLSLVQDAIRQKHISGVGFGSQIVRPVMTNFPYRDNDLWRGDVVFGTTVVET